MDACKKEKFDSVLDSSEECVNSDEEQVETEEWDSSSDKESVASCVDSAVEAISIDCLDTVLDE